MSEKDTTTPLDVQSNLVQKYTIRFRKAQQAVVPKHGLWSKLDIFDRGDQWKDTALPPWVPKPVSNWIRFVRTIKRANLASAIPSAHYTAKDSQYAPEMELLQRAYEHVWQTEKVPRVIRRSIDRSIVQGTAIACVYSDEAYVGGTYVKENSPKNALFHGKICVKRFPNANFFPDPDASSLEDCKYIETTEDNVPLAAVKANKKFREYAGEKLTNLTTSMLSTDIDENGRIYRRDIDPGENGQNPIGDETVTIHTHWERYINENGAWQLDISYYLSGADFLLYRVENVKPGVYSFAVLYDEEEEQDFWGTSTAMDLFENQKIVNRVGQTAAIIGVLHQNPQKVVSRESGINAQDLARTGTMPGKVWTANGDPSQAIHSIEPPEIPKGLFDLDDRISAGIKERAGINEAYTGQSVGSLTTSTGVNALIERATIRDKDKMIQIDAFVEQISDLIILHIMYKWKQRRPITTIQPDGQPSYDIFEPLTDDVIKNLEWIGRSDVYAKSPTTQALRKQQADNLLSIQGQYQFDPPVIIPEEWIRFQDFDMKEEILRRMKKDRERMEREKAVNMAQMLTQLSDVISQHKAQGLAPQEVQKVALQAAEEMLKLQKQTEQGGGKQRDAAKTNGPQGTTGQLAMAAMSRGA